MTEDFTTPPESVPPAPEPVTPEQVPPSAGPDPMSRVKGPAIGLLATAGLGAVGALVGLGMQLLGMGASAVEGQEGMVSMGMASGILGIVQAVVGLAVAGLMIYACLKMMKLQAWGLSLTASILAMIPFVSPCCLLGIPFGIWALVVLMDEHVKAAFNG